MTTKKSTTKKPIEEKWVWRYTDEIDSVTFGPYASFDEALKAVKRELEDINHCFDDTTDVEFYKLEKTIGVSLSMKYLP